MNLTIKGFIVKELTQALRDPRMKALVFGVPVIQTLLFGFAVTVEVRNIRLALVAGPGDAASRRVLERCYASGWFIPGRADPADPVESVSSGQAEAVLVAPPGGLSKALGRGEARLQLLIDATNAVRAQQVERYVRAVAGRALREPGNSQAPGGRAAAGVSLDTRLLYNPTMESSVFMVPGVMCMILSVVTVILTSMSLVKEKDLGTFETLISAPVADWEILLGKTLPYMMIAMVDLTIVLTVAVFAFHVPLRGHVWQIFLGGGVFVCTTCAVGTLVSTVARTQQQAMMGGFLFVFPAILMSGIMFPVENIPALPRLLAYLDPLKYFVSVLRNVMLKGGEPHVYWGNLAAMTGIAAVTVTLAFARLRSKLD
ncbi:MAG: ABC transporter permease [Elusimicrobia bacterium]|nr:ABC transporter permease [Elusimicrobiota bacterium]